jgi:hypothetical protein
MRTSFRPSRGNVAAAVLALAVLVVIGELGVRTAFAPAARAAAPTLQGTPVTGTPVNGTPVARTPVTGTPAPGRIYPLPTHIALIPPPGYPVKATPDEAGGLVSPAAIVRDVTGTRAFNGTVITRAEVAGNPTVSGGTETAEVNETISGGGVIYRVRWAYDVSGGTWTATPEYQVSPGA